MTIKLKWPQTNICRYLLAVLALTFFNFNSALAGESIKAPYILSQQEIATLVNGPLPQIALKRVFSKAIASDAEGPDMTNYFIDAIGDVTIHADQKEYLFGSTFQRHAGFHDYFTIINSQTGEVILASYVPDQLTLMFNACVSKDSKNHANYMIHKWLYDRAMENDKKINGNKSSSDEPAMNIAYPPTKEIKAGTCTN